MPWVMGRWRLRFVGCTPASPGEPLGTTLCEVGGSSHWPFPPAPTTLSQGAVYHLVHGHVLAVVIQPDGHLGYKAELPGGRRIRPWSLPRGFWKPAARPRPQPAALPKVDGLLLR